MNQAWEDFKNHPVHEIELYAQYAYYKTMRFVRFVRYYRQLNEIKCIVNSMPQALRSVLINDAKFDPAVRNEVDYSIINKLVVFIQGTKEVVMEWNHIRELNK